MRFHRRKLVWFSVLAILLTVGIAAAALRGRSDPAVPGVTVHESDEDEDPADWVSVKTIRPKRDPSLRVTVQQLATVEAFFQANLKARVAGVVKYVAKDLGDPVRQGELLVEIDVPDLQQDVAQKESIIVQRQHEALLAQAHVKNADAFLEVSQANILQKQTEVKQAEATREYRVRRLARFRQLASREAISPDVVDEQEQATQAALAAEESARVAVRKAQADYKEKEASREASLAEVKLKESLITVARKDRDRARALADYARITAPFDGVITRRNTDPGEFVQNSTTANTESLVSVSRTDIVTVSMKLPDNAAPFVSLKTDAEIHMDDLPGLTILGKVTRFSPSIEPGDRTMRVEVDLFNGSDADYRRLQTRTLTSALAPLGGSCLSARLALQASGWYVIHLDQKGTSDALPLRPVTFGANLRDRQLLPGMTGYMRLYLDKFTDAYLLPSSAVFTKGGKPYLMVVRDGLTRLVAVKVQVNDGKLAKVAVIARAGDPRTGTREVFRELTGNEEVIASRQLEVGEGQVVHTALQDW